MTFDLWTERYLTDDYADYHTDLSKTDTLTSQRQINAHLSKNMQLSFFQTKLILLRSSPRGDGSSDVSAENTRQ